MAFERLAGIAAGIMKRDSWAKKKWPQLVVGKIAGGFTTTVLGHLAAYEVQGKLQWSRYYEPRQVTDLDEKRIKRLRTKMMALRRQMEKLQAGAYERGYPVNINNVAKITAEREAH
jgi:hypothetical protein